MCKGYLHIASGKAYWQISTCCTCVGWTTKPIHPSALLQAPAKQTNSQLLPCLMIEGLKLTCRYKAAAPATWGVAMLVPLMYDSSVSPRNEALAM